MRNFLPLGAAVALLAGGAAGCRKQKPPPSIEGLSAALERSAEKTLEAQPLAGEQIVVAAKPGEINARAGEVIASATEAGGVGIRSQTGPGEASILATIPENNAEAFEAALRHDKMPMQKPSPGTRLIEVLIGNPAPATPTP